MRTKPQKAAKGLPTDPVHALRARELLAQARQLVAAERWKDAAPLSHALVQLAPGLAEAHEIMGTVALKTGAADIAEACFERAVSIGPATGFRLLHWAKALLALEQPGAAEKVLHRALLVRPDDPAILVDLGDAQLHQQRPREALKSYRRALRADPDHAYAAHLVVALADDSADPTYVARLFDAYASDFDTHLTGKLDYRVPEALVALLGDLQPPPGAALDIGCGTGLVAAALAGQAGPVDGIDLAPRMIDKARERGLYRHLAVGDFLDLLVRDKAFAGPYGLVTAADVFIYVGALDQALPAIAARLAPSGLVAFSIETSTGADVEIRPSGRFAHSHAYIERLAQASGFTILRHVVQAIRLENTRPIPGALYILGRPA